MASEWSGGTRHGNAEPLQLLDDVNLVMSEDTRKRHFSDAGGMQTELGTKAAEGAGVGGAIGGTLGAAALSYALCRWVFDMRWEPTPWIYGTGTLLCILLVLLVGALSSLDVTTRKPLSVLRSQ
jgi:hypothetical protein